MATRRFGAAILSGTGTNEHPGDGDGNGDADGDADGDGDDDGDDVLDGTGSAR